MNVYSEPNCTPLIPGEKIDAYHQLYHDIHSENDASLTSDTTWGKDEVDLTPMIQAGETNTCMRPNDERERIEYLNEHYYTQHGNIQCVTGKQIANWINVEDLKDVDIDVKHEGDVLYWNGEAWVTFNLKNALDAINNKLDNHETRITNIENKLTQIEQQITQLGNRITQIENAIYNWTNDKSTKIPRGNINIFSGDWGGANYIRSRDGTPDNDLRFS